MTSISEQPNKENKEKTVYCKESNYSQLINSMVVTFKAFAKLSNKKISGLATPVSHFEIVDDET